jgi:Domain of unknown function (DUF1835)
MIYHVLPGDAQVGEFKKTNIKGEVIVCRECLIVGDIDAETLDTFWERRAHFILSEYGEDVADYHEKVADELAELLDFDENDEVNLWFEYELFCSVNMWFCLWLLSNTTAEIYRVEPVVLSNEDRWLGFGGFTADELKTCFDAHTRFTPQEIALGAALWNAYRANDRATLADLSNSTSVCFPYLNEVCEAAIEKDSRPREIIAEIQFEGKTDFDEIFSEFTRRAGVYGFGDSQVRRLLETD